MQRSCKVNQLSGALFNLFAIDKACFCQGVTNCRFLIQACNLVANGLVAPLNITFYYAPISRHFHYITQSLIIYRRTKFRGSTKCFKHDRSGPPLNNSTRLFEIQHHRQCNSLQLELTIHRVLCLKMKRICSFLSDTSFSAVWFQFFVISLNTIVSAVWYFSISNIFSVVLCWRYH